MIIKAENDSIMYIAAGIDTIYMNICDDEWDYHFNLSRQDALKIIESLTYSLNKLGKNE